MGNAVRGSKEPPDRYVTRYHRSRRYQIRYRYRDRYQLKQEDYVHKDGITH
jgi:hypothetical protein